MIFGDCPYENCEGTHALPSPEVTPKFGKEVCEKCKREFYQNHLVLLITNNLIASLISFIVFLSPSSYFD